MRIIQLDSTNMLPLIILAVRYKPVADIISSVINTGSSVTQNYQLLEMQADINTIAGNLANQNTMLQSIETGITHQSNMLSAIQSSISAIGMSSTIGCVLSAVNVYQLVQVQKKLSQLENKLDQGFIDLKQFFTENLNNLLEQQQRQRLAEAYSYYIRGLEQLKTSCLIEDKSVRNNSLAGCIATFNSALSVYDNSYWEQTQVNLPAQLRRLECVWAISSAIAEVHCLQAEYRAGLHGYQELRKRILRDVEILKPKLNEYNYQFAIGDLQWIFEIDVKIVASKIHFLEDYQKQSVFPAVTLPEPVMLNETGLHTISLGGVNQYLDCSLVESKANEVMQFVQRSRQIKANITALPLLQVCNVFHNEKRLLTNDGIAIKLEALVAEYAKQPETGIYCLNNIPAKKLAGAYSSYAQAVKTNKPLALCDSTVFGTATEGFLLTTHAMVSSSLNTPLLYNDIVSINLSDWNNNFRPYINNLPINTSGIIGHKLFTLLKNQLNQLWYQRGTVLRRQGQHQEAQAAYQRALKLMANDLDSLEGLLIIQPTIENIKTYITEVKKFISLSRLDALKVELEDQNILDLTVIRFSENSFYLGHCNNEQQPYGEGIRIWANGDYYEGVWQNGKRHGKGKFTSMQFTYNGEWKDDGYAGTGVMTWSNGDYYNGKWLNNARHGRGIFTSADGERYDGDWDADKRHGRGQLNLVDGSRYGGEFKQNMLQGYGSMLYRNKDRYEGQWFAGVRSGTGTLIYANGDSYTGDWVAGLRHGQGRLTLANGSYYIGQWESDQRHGYGTMLWNNHENNRKSYEGAWQADLPHGNGTMQWQDGSVYIGEYKNGMRNGQGTFTWSNGDVYTGDWINNLRHGNGQLKWAVNSASYQGLWHEDKPIENMKSMREFI